MKKVILKPMFLSSLLLMMSSCASGTYVKSVSFWHIGNFLEFVVIVGLGAFVFLLYNKIQAIDEKLSRLIDLLQGNSNPNPNTYNPTNYVNVQQPQQPAPQQNTQPAPQQPAPQQPVVKYCPDCGTSVDANISACPNCGCPLN